MTRGHQRQEEWILDEKLKGLTSQEVELSRKAYGSNVLTQVPPDPLWKKILEGFKDPMIIILLVALAIQTVLFFMGQAEWYEPVCVLAAIMLANGVAAVSESKQEGKASALKAETEGKETAKAMRDGRLAELRVSEVVVDDVVYLQAGDKVPADGEVLSGEVKVDQAALNGETEEARKTPGTEYDAKDLLNAHYVYKGTVVCGGEAYVRIKQVGDATLFGQLALEVQEDTRETPLQVKLGKLAKQISTFGYVGAALIVAGVLGRTVLTGGAPGDLAGWVRLVIDAVTVAVTIIVCAVPEGLPMLTSILLSFQSIRMIKDNVLVHKINGLETAGSVNILFSDKTGTITEGRLSVAGMAGGDAEAFPEWKRLAASVQADLAFGIGVNNGSSWSGGSVIGGNNTDRALMGYLGSIGVAEGIDKSGVVDSEPFDSAKKYASVTVERKGKRIVYVKGAAERIIEKCSRYEDHAGTEYALDDRAKLDKYQLDEAGRSMRLLAVAKHEPGAESGWTLVCVLSIRDNVRKEAIPAIANVRKAGVQVVMVTGDRKETAVAIAKEAGLLHEGEMAITSQDLAAMPDQEVKNILPKLRVVARALPMDKSRLVKIAQEMDYVVGMTGDGVNDSPALKKADVGFAMGSGTEVAKEAGDITILDDNFVSIGKAILYGRTMFKSIRKFLVFQLTVNVAAVLTCFIGPMLGENVIFTVVQLLMVNLAMDTLAAIAFGSEPARAEYMLEKPVPRSEGIVTGPMMVRVVVMALYITVAVLCILYVPWFRAFFGNVDTTYLKSAMFATFMMAITFNGFNARTDHVNFLDGIMDNKNFLYVMGGILLLQFVFVTFGGVALSVEPLNPRTWGVCAAIALGTIVLDTVRKLVTKK